MEWRVVFIKNDPVIWTCCFEIKTYGNRANVASPPKNSGLLRVRAGSADRCRVEAQSCSCVVSSCEGHWCPSAFFILQKEDGTSTCLIVLLWKEFMVLGSMHWMLLLFWIAAAVLLGAVLILVKTTHMNSVEFVCLYYPENWEMSNRGWQGEGSRGW